MKHLFASCAVIALMAAPALAQSTYESTEPVVPSEQTLDPTMRDEAEAPTQFEQETAPIPEAGPVEASETPTDQPEEVTAPLTEQSESTTATSESDPVASAEPVFATESVAEAEAFEAQINEAELPQEYSTDDLNALMLAQMSAASVQVAQVADTAGTNAYASTESVAAPAAAPRDEAVSPQDYAATPAADPVLETQSSTDGSVTAEGDIDQTAVQIAANDERFTTLVELIGIAELQDTLNQEGPYTVFAPTNEAFAALPPQTLAHLKSEAGKAELTEILKDHVAEGEVLAANVPLAGQSVETLGASSLVLVGSTDGTLNIDGSSTIGDGIAASNGVVYAIDTVILPVTTQE